MRACVWKKSSATWLPLYEIGQWHCRIPASYQDCQAVLGHSQIITFGLRLTRCLRATDQCHFPVLRVAAAGTVLGGLQI
jgi:hypothetical protein